MEKFEFIPAQGFKDSSAFPDPANETETREQLQRLHDQTKTYINKLSAMYGAEVVMFRINNAKGLEFSIDGKNWEEIVGRGERGPVGPGVAPGGTIGQHLLKRSNNDYDTVWADLNIASMEEPGTIKAQESTNHTSTIVKKSDNTLKVNQLVINELNIENAPVQTLSTPYWFDIESEFTKYIDVVVEGCVETAKVDHCLFDTAFDKKWGYIECRDGVLRFLLKTDIEDISISTIVKELIIQYQD